MKLGDKVILFGFIDGCSYETTGQTNFIIALETGERVEIPFGGAINVNDMTLKDNIKLKDVIARIKKLDLNTQKVWLDGILKELGDDYGSMKYREGYEQGKLEGSWVGNQLKDADKIRQELNKVKVPQFVAEIIEYYKKQNATLYDALREKNFNKQYADWLLNEQGAYDKVARAWLDGYEIQGRKYVVTDGNHLYFKNYQEDIEIVILVDEQPGTMEYVKKFDTKKEAQKAADILGWKVQEVEE